MTAMTSNSRSRTPANDQVFSKRSAILCLLLVAPMPSIGVWFAAFGATGTLGSAIWGFAKVWLLLGPLVCWWVIQKQPRALPVFSSKGLAAGAISGVVLLVVIVAAYILLARDKIDFNDMKSLLAQAGISGIGGYLAVVCYLTLINSLIEEYVFRWFMFTQLQRLIPGLAAVLVSGLIFTAHHTLVLSAYIPWQFNVLASLGVLSGGLIWSYLYYRYRSIWPGYLSHIGADIGVFLIGYDALF